MEQAKVSDKPNGSGYVYFIHATESDRIKIGKSVDPKKRLSGLQTSSSETLRLLLSLPAKDMAYEERQMHELFASERIRGEWFYASKGLLGFIDRLTKQQSTNTDGMVVREEPARSFLKVPEKRAVRSLGALQEAGDRVCGHSNILSNINWMEIEAYVHPDCEIPDSAVDIWPRESVDRNSKILRDPVRSMLGGIARRSGTSATARMLYHVRRDEQLLLTVMLLAFHREIDSGRTGHWPEEWDAGSRRFFYDTCMMVRREVNDMDWFEGWSPLSTQSFPGMNNSVNEHAWPGNAKALMTLLHAQVTQMLCQYQTVKIVPMGQR